MFQPFVHNIDPIIFSVAGVHIWWYGLGFTLGFINMHINVRRNREKLGLSLSQVYELTLFFALGVLVGGRALVVVNNEWEFYSQHLSLILAIWIGGFATHGLIFGGATGVGLFCLKNKVPFRPILDVLAISACFILGCGRIGNFIDGQIYGSLTDFPLAVKFPEVEGYRHAVVLYDGLKNFLLIPFLLWVRSRGVPDGRIAALFVFLYAALRIPIDLLREYPITMWGFPTGQTLNLLMVGLGTILLIISFSRKQAISNNPKVLDEPKVGWRKIAFICLLIIPIVIPSDATRDIPDRYGNRHKGLVHSAMYPSIANELKK
jgi:phosphatidylglycerol---prolipoprotein diacylglyceryl transferase